MRTCVLLIAACSAPAKPAATTPPLPSPAIAKACASAEHRQLDFWIGDWDVTIRARQSPASETWGEAKGRQRIEAILGGCAIAEHFTADGPQTPWAGKSYSSWQPAAGKWRQTWVDDQGSYLALTGGVESGVMTLYGEPRTTQDGKSFQMRMVFLDVTPRSLRWEWQRSEDSWQTSVVMMRIDYVRR
jgi:hypothetical protein